MSASGSTTETTNGCGAYRAFAGEPRLGLLDAACLASCAGARACQRCARSCPAQALVVEEGGPTLAGSCLGCGRCAAACPSGALAVQGFAAAPMLPNGSAAIVVECWKVPQAVSGSAALRVPCLGGIIQSHLLALAVAGRRPIQFIDRGWCAHCRAGGGDGHPAQRLVDGANALFDACGWFQDARIRLVTDALPLGLMPEDIPDAATQARLGRRAFFRRLTTELVRSVSPQAQFPRVSAGTLRRRGVSPLPERDSVLDVVGEMARTQGRPLPTSLFPALQMSDVCRHHGVCAGVCPTGALRVHERNDAGGVDFDAAACLACGLCIDSCPEGAISFATRQSTPSRDLPERLTRHPWRICPDCLRDYPGAESDERCPNCEKRRELARNLFGPFFAKPVSNNLFFSTGGKHHE